MEKSQLDWGDLLYLHTLARSRSLQDAAEKLEVNRTTVSRKIDSLEQALGVKLFIKTGRDLVITEVGEMVLKSANVIRGEVAALKSKIRERNDHLSGMVRVTATPRICVLLEPALSKFLLENRDLQVELSASMQVENLNALESDIALRLTHSPPDELVGRKLAELTSALYANSEVAASLSDSDSLRFISGPAPMNVEDWVEDDLGFVPQEVLKSNSADLIVQFVRSGVGVACLPCYMGELETGLVRVSDVRRSQMPELWMLYSPKHRGVARIQAIAALIEETVIKLKPIIEGQDLIGI